MIGVGIDTELAAREAMQVHVPHASRCDNSANRRSGITQ
jgi:hypothetical protein